MTVSRVRLVPGFEDILGMDRRAALRRTDIIRTDDFDLLLQELNALIMLDQKTLEKADAQTALQAAKNLARNIREAETDAADKPSVNGQRQRLLVRRRRRCLRDPACKINSVPVHSRVTGRVHLTGCPIESGAAWVSSAPSKLSTQLAEREKRSTAVSKPFVVVCISRGET